jgi:hypothetical protein
LRITKSKATVYTFSGGRRYLSRAAALGGLAKQFLRNWLGYCDDPEMYSFAIRELTKLFARAENEGGDDAWIAAQWERLYDAEYNRLYEERRKRAEDLEHGIEEPF